MKGKLSALFRSTQVENVQAQLSGKSQQKFMYKMYGVKTNELGKKTKTNQCVRNLHILP